MSPWLPLVTPRPGPFEVAAMPDLAARDRPEIFEALFGAREDRATGHLLRAGPSGPIREDVPGTDDCLPLRASLRHEHTCLVYRSFPLITGCWVFNHGCPDEALMSHGKCSDLVRGIAARSFVSWNAGDPGRPLYRLDKMTWLEHVPRPDLDDLPPETPVQVIIPFSRPKASGHLRIAMASRLEEDLAVMGEVYGWGEPLAPRTVNMPRHFV